MIQSAGSRQVDKRGSPDQKRSGTSVSESCDTDSPKPQCGDPGHQITLCEINGIKTFNIDGYLYLLLGNNEACL